MLFYRSVSQKSKHTPKYRDAVKSFGFTIMASITKYGLKNFLTTQIQKVVPLQVLSNHLSTTVWTPPEKLNLQQPLNRGWIVSKRKPRKFQFPIDKFNNKPVQDWWDWDGFGKYRFRQHHYPNNVTLRDAQRRRIFKNFAEERLRVNSIFKNEILPKELRTLAYEEEIHQIPRDSAITRLNRRCAITGRARGIFHQFRVSRFIFRHEADYNRLSGVQRALWEKSVFIDP